MTVMTIPPAAHIILVGMMGCGKSTTGGLLAQRLNIALTDTDTLVVSAAGRTIAQIIGEDGEAAFRRMERQALQQALKLPPRVIATGGGIVLDAANRGDMRAAGRVIYLQADSDVLLPRLQTPSDPPRPLLGDDAAALAGRIDTLLAQRDGLYRQAAHAVVSQHQDEMPAMIADKILPMLRQ